MHALVAYKHSVTPDLVGIEIRQMTCFNGFNTGGAFGPKSNGFRFDVTVQLGVNDQAARINPPVPTTGQFEVIGMGWLSHHANSSMTAENIPSTISGNREIVAMRLNLEHVTGRFLNTQSYAWQTGSRERTPHELLIGRTVMALTVAPNARSTFHKACAFNQSYQNVLFDFVGSERPSGAAVAYLQVYRNTSAVILAALSPKLSAANSFLHQLDPRGAHVAAGVYKSFIPLLSSLFNNGSDSDIFSFSETPFITLQGMKFGTFALCPFFQDPRPMVTEGRYAKGSQSDHLRRNVADRARVCNLNPQEHRINIMQTFDALRQIEDAANFSSLLINPTSAHNNITRAWETYTRLANGQPFASTVSAFQIMVAGFVDIRVPSVATPEVAEATARSAGAATNFQQWVAQATQETPAS